MSAPTRINAILLAALMVTSILTFAPTTGAQSGDDIVPVSYTSVQDNAQLHFWRDGSECSTPEVTDPTGSMGVVGPGSCNLRIQDVPQSGENPDPKTERRQLNTDDELSTDEVTRFVLDTGGEETGADYPFTIKQGSGAIKVQFFYSSEANCVGGIGGQSVDFDVRLFKAGADQAQVLGGGTEIAAETTTECNPAVTGTQTRAYQVNIDADLPQDVAFDEGEYLAVQLNADSASAGTWTLYFEDSTYDSRVEIRTDGAVERALWATDLAGTFKESFDPTANKDARYMVGRMALRSPFGGDAVPSSGFAGELVDPDGQLVALNADGTTTPSGDDRRTSVPMTELSSSSAKDGARKVFKFAEIEGISGTSVQPWHYVSGAQSGSYTLRVQGSILGNQATLTRGLAMGSFAFNLGPVDGEQTVHQLKPDSSTTFLIELSNAATVADSYEISTEFVFSSRNTVWTVDVVGVDAKDRVSLDKAGQPDDATLLRVTLTPPSDSRAGDAARVRLTAESLGSDATKTVNLEGQVVTETERDTGIVLLRGTEDDPFPIGIDQTNTVRLFAWNKGTASDSFTASIVDGSFQGTNTANYDVELAQSRVDNVAPGDVATIPIDVTTNDNVLGNESFAFDVEVKSVARPSETATSTLNTRVEAVRSFEFFGLEGINDEALSSVRHGKFNMSGFGSAEECEERAANPNECGLYTRYAFHRFTLANTGNQPETFALSTVNSRLQGDCTGPLSGEIEPRIVQDVELNTPDQASANLSQVTVDPGAVERFYLRVEYPGEIVPPDTGFGACGVGDRATFVTGVKATPDQSGETTLTAQIRETKTVVHVAEQIRDLPSTAQARLSLTEETAPEGDGLVESLPDLVAVEPGGSVEVNFTLSEQSGHEDRVKLRVGPRDRIDTLEDRGWNITLTARGNLPFERAADGGIILPDPSDLGPGTSDNPDAATAIGHSSGVDYPLTLIVKAPTTGLQENERQSFVVTATSMTRASTVDDLGIDVQVGEDFAFELERGRDTIKAHPGDTIALGLGIHNTGATRDTYDIEASAPSSYDAPAVQPARLTVSPTSTKASAITVDVPDGAQVGSTATITATVTNEGDPDDPDDSETKEVTYQLEIEPEGTLDVSATQEVVRISPDGNATVNFTITNEGGNERTVDIVQLFAPDGWTTTLSQSNTSLSVGAGDSRAFQYLIEAPGNIVEGSRYSFMIQARDGDDFANGVAFAVVQGQNAVSLEPEDERVVVDRGGTSTFDVLVRNLGTGPTFYQLTTQFETNGWSSQILDQEGNVIDNRTVRVPEQTFKRVQVQVNAPTQVAKGHVEEIQVKATATGGGASDEIVLEAPIHDHAVEFSLESPATQDVGPGDDVEVLVSITNAGNGPDTIALSFEDTNGGDPVWAVDTDLQDDTTPELEPGETLSGVRATVIVPSPNQGPVPSPDGVTTVMRATSTGAPTSQAPTATAEVTTKLVPYIRLDVDGDNVFEVALDLNRNSADGFEVFADRDDEMAARGEIAEGDGTQSTSLYVLDGDEDDRQEHLIDTDGNGISDIYFDPDKAQTSRVPYTIDVNDDREPEEPLDTEFDGLIDKVYDTATGEIWDARNLDFSGDGRRDLLLDTDNDGVFDTFVDPNQSPHVVTEVEQDGDRYEMDTDGDGKKDTVFNTQTGEVSEASTTNLQDFFNEYWYFVVIFIIVLALFAVIVVRRV